jgi:hypothetical protein
MHGGDLIASDEQKPCHSPKAHATQFRNEGAEQAVIGTIVIVSSRPKGPAGLQDAIVARRRLGCAQIVIPNIRAIRV